jgi:hypothetical protein
MTNAVVMPAPRRCETAVASMPGMGPMARTIGLGVATVWLGAVPLAGQSPPQPVTSDTPEYCLHLLDRVSDLPGQDQRAAGIAGRLGGPAHQPQYRRPAGQRGGQHRGRRPVRDGVADNAERAGRRRVYSAATRFLGCVDGVGSAHQHVQYLDADYVPLGVSPSDARSHLVASTNRPPVRNARPGRPSLIIAGLDHCRLLRRPPGRAAR